MSKTRFAVLGLAVGSGVLAIFLAKNFIGQPPQQQVVEVNKVETVDVLVAAKNTKMGDRISAADLTWQSWPQDLIKPFMITRSARPEAKTKFKDGRARSELFEGEPINEKKLILPNSAGFLAAILPKGMRAISVRISAETGAGGFILPNDRVDVLLTTKLGGSGKRNRTLSEAVLTNVRVLAIDQTLRQNEKGEKPDVVGKTATLELEPLQAEVLAKAETVGQLTLALRSLADNGDSELGDAGPRTAPKYAKGGQGGEVKVLRYGIEQVQITSE